MENQKPPQHSTDEALNQGFANIPQFNPDKYSLDLGSQLKTMNDDFEKFQSLVKNPLALANMFLGLKTAMDNFNGLLLELNKTLKALDTRVASIEQSRSVPTAQAQPAEARTLSPRDKEIFKYVQSRGRVCAEDLQEHFEYKGKHAASARLNKLFTLKLLRKEHAGRTVYYMPVS